MLVSSRATQLKLSKSSEGQGLRTDPAAETAGRTGRAEQKTPSICSCMRAELEECLVPEAWLLLGGVNQMLWDDAGRCHAGNW